MKKLFFALFSLSIFGIFACKSEAVQDNANSNFTGIREIDVWTEKMALAPTDTTLFIGRYNAAMTTENYQIAIEDAKSLINLDSTRVVYYRMLGNAFFENNDTRNAIKILEKGVERFPEDTYTKLTLAEMNFVLENYESATVMLENILKLEPFNIGSLYMLGQLKKEIGDTMQAMGYFQAVVEIDADHHDAYIQLAKLSDKKNLPIALKYIDNALRIDSTSLVAWMTKASYYHQRGDLKQALSMYEMALSHHATASEVYYNMGLIYLEQHDAEKNTSIKSELLEKAIKAFDTSTKYDVTFSAAYYYLALSYEKLGDKVAAKRHYENSLNFGDELQLAKSALDRLVL